MFYHVAIEILAGVICDTLPNVRKHTGLFGITSISICLAISKVLQSKVILPSHQPDWIHTARCQTRSFTLRIRDGPSHISYSRVRNITCDVPVGSWCEILRQCCDNYK